MPSPLAASADSRVLLRWNVQSSVPLFCLQLTEPQQRDDRSDFTRGFRDTMTDMHRSGRGSRWTELKTFRKMEIGGC